MCDRDFNPIWQGQAMSKHNSWITLEWSWISVSWLTFLESVAYEKSRERNMEDHLLQYELGHRNGDLIFTVKSIVRPLLLLSIDWGLCEIFFWNGFICVTCQHIPGQFDLQTRVPWVCSQWKPSSKQLKYLQHVPANKTRHRSAWHESAAVNAMCLHPLARKPFI